MHRALAAFVPALVLLVGMTLWDEERSGAGFNGGPPLNVNSSTRLCNDPHPPLGTLTDHLACVDNVAPGATPGVRRRTEFDDGSVFADWAAALSGDWPGGGHSTDAKTLYYTSGLIHTPPGANGTTVADFSADLDFMCDGALDAFFPAEPVIKRPEPGFAIVDDAAPNQAPANYPDYAYYQLDVPGFALAGSIAVLLPAPMTYQFYTYAPGWAGVDPNTYVTQVIWGGDPNPPPNAPICTQSPFRSTVNFPGSCGTCGYNPYANPGGMGAEVYLWEMYVGVQDYWDGFVEEGPTAGTNERAGGSVANAVLRNVQCISVGFTACPPDTSAQGNPALCNDGGLWEDTDGDGLPDAIESAWGTLCNDVDSDNLCKGVSFGIGDGLTDFEEMAAMTNPRDMDTDGDGSCTSGLVVGIDSIDDCPNKANSGFSDTDGDATGDACDPDDDNDGINDDAELAGIYVAYVNDMNIMPGSTPGLICRPWAEAAAGAYGGAVPAYAKMLGTAADAANPDVDGDGIVDGRECAAGSAPDDDSGGPAGVQTVCIGVPNGVGAACTSGVAGGPVGTVGTLAPTAAGSRPELEDSALADDDGDGLPNEENDPDNDGLAEYLEPLARTKCIRLVPGSYSKPPDYNCGAGSYPGTFENNLDRYDAPSDTLDDGTTDIDPNSDCSNLASCTGQQICVWTASAGYTADTFSTGATGGAGCDGPEWMRGLSEQNFNEDGDGLSTIKSTAATQYGSNRTTDFGGVGAIGGCSPREEAANGTNIKAPRDFFDVNNSGKIDAVDIGLVRGAFGAVAGTSAVYKRTLDINAGLANGGRGSGKIDAVDIGLVRSQFNKTCLSAP